MAIRQPVGVFAPLGVQFIVAIEVHHNLCLQYCWNNNSSVCEKTIQTSVLTY